ncbi:hypothetical protein CBR_g550 [Chara braunii]|uniref:Uncharacterized protein n=1 Tax=Chara braunii TaxID=69332 RepID=A0A388KBH9_CHABU|nr:hypothetical protein CBR_g550 [Chara braunii]|eukprot:GBG67415.1 hypothetical protein CBR_g550 [Chara braunii]
MPCGVRVLIPSSCLVCLQLAAVEHALVMSPWPAESASREFNHRRQWSLTPKECMEELQGKGPLLQRIEMLEARLAVAELLLRNEEHSFKLFEEDWAMESSSMEGRENMDPATPSSTQGGGAKLSRTRVMLTAPVEKQDGDVNSEKSALPLVGGRSIVSDADQNVGGREGVASAAQDVASMEDSRWEEKIAAVKSRMGKTLPGQLQATESQKLGSLGIGKLPENYPEQTALGEQLWRRKGKSADKEQGSSSSTFESENWSVLRIGARESHSRQWEFGAGVGGLECAEEQDTSELVQQFDTLSAQLYSTEEEEPERGSEDIEDGEKIGELEVWALHHQHQNEPGHCTEVKHEEHFDVENQTECQATQSGTGESGESWKIRKCSDCGREMHGGGQIWESQKGSNFVKRSSSLSVASTSLKHSDNANCLPNLTSMIPEDRGWPEMMRGLIEATQASAFIHPLEPIVEEVQDSASDICKRTGASPFHSRLEDESVSTAAESMAAVEVSHTKPKVDRVQSRISSVALAVDNMIIQSSGCEGTTRDRAATPKGRDTIDQTADEEGTEQLGERPSKTGQELAQVGDVRLSLAMNLKKPDTGNNNENAGTQGLSDVVSSKLEPNRELAPAGSDLKMAAPVNFPQQNTFNPTSQAGRLSEAAGRLSEGVSSDEIHPHKAGSYVVKGSKTSGSSIGSSHGRHTDITFMGIAKSEEWQNLTMMELLRESGLLKKGGSDTEDTTVVQELDHLIEDKVAEVDESGEDLFQSEKPPAYKRGSNKRSSKKKRHCTVM